jgi:hypothetical protein
LTVCQWFCLKIIEIVFSDLTSKPVAMIFSGLVSKPVATVFFGLTSKPMMTVSPGLASKPVVGFLVEPQNQCGEEFFDLGLKTDSYGLIICVLKSPRWFLCLCLRTKQTTVCRLRHKTDGRMTVWDTRRDQAA